MATVRTARKVTTVRKSAPAKAARAKSGAAAVKRATTVKPVVRAARKAGIKVPTKPVIARKPAQKAVKAVAPRVVTAPKKVKLVRDSFSFPKHEHALLAELKGRAQKLGQDFKKSEVLRAGIQHLAAMADTALMAALAKVERVKTGRPAKKSKKK